MNSRERVMMALNHQEPDRVPINMIVTIDVYKDLRKKLSLLHLPEEIPMGHWTDVKMPLEMVKALGIDAYYISAKSSNKASMCKKLEDGSFVDEWGLFWRKIFVNQEGGYLFQLENPPLAKATIEDLASYEWPDPEDPVRYAHLKEEVAFVRANSDLAIFAKFAGATFELATYMRGHEQWYMDLLINPDFANALMSKLVDIQMKINENSIKLVGRDVDVIRLSGEDLGTQVGPLISPKTFRKVVKPHLKKLYSFTKELLHQYNPQAKLLLHSCGDVYPFIPDLIDCGIDVLDPIQPLAHQMDRFKLKQEFGDSLCFHGAIDTQKVLPEGNKEEIRNEVKTAIKALGMNGGYWLAPAHNVQTDVSAESVLTMIDAAKEYGKYPLSL